MTNPPLLEQSLRATANRDAALMQFTLRIQALYERKASELNATTVAADLAKKKKIFELAAAGDRSSTLRFPTVNGRPSSASPSESRALAQKDVGRAFARDVLCAFIAQSTHIDGVQKMLPGTE